MTELPQDIQDMTLKESVDALMSNLQNERKWRNVQTVLPESFGLVARVLTQQAQLIHKLEHRIEEMKRAQAAAASSDHAAALEERVCTDAKHRMARLRKEVSGRLDQQQMIIQQIEQNLEQRCSQIDERIDQLVQSTQHQLKDQDLHFKSARILDEDKLAQLRQDVVQKVEDLESQLSEARKEAVVVPVIKEVAVASPEIPERNVNAIREDLARVSLDVKDAEARIDYQIAALRQELVMTIGKKLCKSEVTKLLSRKMDAMDAWKQLAEKADSTRVEEVACTLMDSIQRHQESTMGDVERLRQLSESKANALELVQVKHNMHNILSVAESIQHELSTLQREVNEKMTVADVKELLDSQSTMNGLQEAMKQVENAAVGDFMTKAQYENINRQIQAITRQLRSEIYQARYIWKDGRPSAKQTIQWSSQVAAFFTNYCPSIQVLVNGEPAILMRSPSDKKEVARSASYGVRRLHHSAGNVAGLSVEVFLALPARALVAISYDIDEKAQGFLNLRKL
ncbi:hypothetical protein PC118_g5749 [Phytophthora cactorum]|uniref:Uncharacterized protein n=1 Tax=Phytophthora cactorum TaxID=29920 RepID=A0A8T0ZAT5_9STRA|nr:hypothetical protein PC112_g10139 [Phytophthora cactorum]KAG2829916.1 hypothetical protein PC111_g7574 [Phytophthora cactorum]KAG2859331.1 hypothetical protein PC113_g9027 [Phytophthora cactorum]KAG2911673.1 hypothetical protein PC114_g9270 [Phytophthora cactorum]KAG2920846.1 hypothetical protein PC115_g9681 [Phytophthora cactorum]